MKEFPIFYAFFISPDDNIGNGMNIDLRGNKFPCIQTAYCLSLIHILTLGGLVLSQKTNQEKEQKEQYGTLE